MFPPALIKSNSLHAAAIPLKKSSNESTGIFVSLSTELRKLTGSAPAAAKSLAFIRTEYHPHVKNDWCPSSQINGRGAASAVSARYVPSLSMGTKLQSSPCTAPFRNVGRITSLISLNSPNSWSVGLGFLISCFIVRPEHHF